MAVQWQRDLPIAKESVVNPKRQNVELFRSEQFSARSIGPYQIVVMASWADDPKNGSNTFYCKHKVVMADSDRESENLCIDDAPRAIRASIPVALIDLLKWNGCHSFGPWYYFENVVFLAGDRDCNGLRVGERRQIVNGRTKELAWHRVGIDAEGNEVELHRLEKYADGDIPPVETMTLAWRPWCRVGEGKVRELDAARDIAIWPDATNEQLCSPALPDLLKERLPALLVEFRAVIEGLGFVW